MTEKNEIEVLYPDPRTIVIKGRKFTIGPMVLGQSMKMLKIISEVLITLAQKMPGLKIDSKDLQKVIAPFIEVAGDKMKDIYAIILDEDPVWINENLDMKSGMLILNAFLEMNDIPFLLAEIKKTAQMVKEQKSGSAK